MLSMREMTVKFSADIVEKEVDIADVRAVRKIPISLIEFICSKELVGQLNALTYEQGLHDGGWRLQVFFVLCEEIDTWQASKLVTAVRVGDVGVRHFASELELIAEHKKEMSKT